MVADLLNVGCGPFPLLLSGAELVPLGCLPVPPPVLTVAGVECSTVVNLDYTPFPGVQMVVDIRQVDFPSGAFKAIRAHEFIEHFEKWDGDRILSGFFQWLAKGGRVEIKVPDVLALATFLVDPSAPDRDEDFIGRIYAHGAHRWGFTPKTLRETLERHGFSDVLVTRRLEVRDMVATATKP